MIAYPRIPENIVVHLGAPDSNAENVIVSFADYIKNVASSEIYPSWESEAIRANVLAQISVALNRVYTEFYRSRGYDFDITSSPAYDQTFIYQRNIYDNVAQIVDEIFDSYIRRIGNIEPLFATFCDGDEVVCNGLSQWGSLQLAKEGLSAFEILKRYYGENIEIVDNVPVENISESAPKIPLKEGDTGRDVELIQLKLNRISKNFPGIPKIPKNDGFFDESTTAAVRKFQEVFELTPDGIVGRATWNMIQFIYNGVKQLSTINSEGLRIEDISTEYNDVLRVGDASAGVLALQYFLGYISLFVNTVIPTRLDGAFGEATRNSVISYQKTYGLSESGEVDEITWNSIQNTYYSLLNSVEYQFTEGATLPFPGRVLRAGTEGEDVRALQEYLNFISESYPQIPKVTPDGDYGTATANQVRAFKELFNIPGDPERVSAQTWYAITSVYDDLYNGNSVNVGQFPGYEV
jgi:peptidoglycan hydrolase-like protein with peptidoglycan-binding domain